MIETHVRFAVTDGFSVWLADSASTPEVAYLRWKSRRLPQMSDPPKRVKVIEIIVTGNVAAEIDVGNIDKCRQQDIDA